jgi:hypothetical protein
MAPRYNPNTNLFDRWFPKSYGAWSRRTLDEADDRRRLALSKRQDYTHVEETENLQHIRIGVFYPSAEQRPHTTLSRQVVDFPESVVRQLFISDYNKKEDENFCAHDYGLRFCKEQNMSEDACCEILLQHLTQNGYTFHSLLQTNRKRLHIFLWMRRDSQQDPGTLTLVIDGPVDEIGPYVSI